FGAGTRPRYTRKTVAQAREGRVDAFTALGVLSAIVWILIITISVKRMAPLAMDHAEFVGVLPQNATSLRVLAGTNPQIIGPKCTGHRAQGPRPAANHGALRLIERPKD